MADRFTGWPLVTRVKTAKAEEVVTTLRQLFSVYGVP